MPEQALNLNRQSPEFGYAPDFASITTPGSILMKTLFRLVKVHGRIIQAVFCLSIMMVSAPERMALCSEDVASVESNPNDEAAMVED